MSTPTPTFPIPPSTLLSCYKHDQTMQQERRPWTEKYRPRQLRGVAFQQSVVQVLQATLISDSTHKASDVPNLLFHGAPGTGKTSTIHAIARQWFPSDDLFRQRVLELNASDDRGVNVVRNQVIAFARQPVMPDPSGRVPPFRLLILDEADAMTDDAQAALRRTMEKYATYTRFCLLCNYLSGLLAPLTSRCAAFHFHSPTSSQMVRRLSAIAQREQLLLGANATEHQQLLRLYAEHSDGDMRRALHWLQCLQGIWRADRKQKAHSNTDVTKKAEEDRCDAEMVRTVLANMSARPPQSLVVSLKEILVHSERHTYLQWHKKVTGKVFYQGYSVVACLQMICDALLEHAHAGASTPRIAEYLERLTEIDAALHQGADGQLQMLSLFHPRAGTC